MRRAAGRRGRGRLRRARKQPPARAATRRATAPPAPPAQKARHTLIAAGSGLTIGSRPVEGAREAARAALETSGAARAEIALVFATADAYQQGGDLLNAVRAVTGAAAIVGCSGGGVLTDRAEAEGVAAVAVMVVATDGTPAVKPFLVSGLDTLAADAGAELSRRTGMAGAEDGCLLVLPDPASLSPDDFLFGLAGRLDPVAVVGGVPGGVPPFELYATDIVYGALTGLAIRASPIVGVAQACEPIGEPHVVTGVVANAIHSIGGRPPVQILREAIESVPDHAERIARAGVFAGLAIDIGKAQLGRGDFIVRSLAGLDQGSGTITLTEPVFVGQTIQFQIPDPRAAREDLEAVLARMRAALGGRRPAFGVYFNCAGRGEGLYGVPSHDVTLIRERLGEWPLIGFFANGEFAPVGTENYFHTAAGVLVVFPQPD